MRWSREGCEINSTRTGHHQQVRQDTRLYTRAPRWQMLFPATSPNTPLGRVLLAPNMVRFSKHQGRGRQFFHACCQL